MRATLSLILAASALGACSDGEGADSLRKEVGDLRADVQRLQKENDKLASQLAGQVRRIDGLTDDVGHVRQMAVDVKLAATPADGPAAAAAAPSGAAPAGAPLSVDDVAIKHFLSTEEGRKAVESAIQAEREARDRERTARALDSVVDRFAKQAGLTADQTTRLKEIMVRQGEAVRTLWSNIRTLGPDATQEERDAMRQQNIAKTQELRKQADDEVRVLLSQTQYETYEKEQDRLRAAMRGPGTGQAVAAPGAGNANGAGGNAGRRNGRQTNN